MVGAIHGLGVSGSLRATGTGAALLDHLHEGDHKGHRVKRLKRGITEAVKLASPQALAVLASRRSAVLLEFDA